MTREIARGLLGWLPDGRMLMASMHDRRILRADPDGVLREHADLSRLTPWFINDMLVDPAGRAFVGCVGYDLLGDAQPQPADLLRVEADGSTDVAATEMDFPNGMVPLEDTATLLVAETRGRRISAFTVGPSGKLTEQRT
jgi:sugar lactone lactonase YvrE